MPRGNPGIGAFVTVAALRVEIQTGHPRFTWRALQACQNNGGVNPTGESMQNAFVAGRPRMHRLAHSFLEQCSSRGCIVNSFGCGCEVERMPVEEPPLSGPPG